MGLEFRDQFVFFSFLVSRSDLKNSENSHSWSIKKINFLGDVKGSQFF